MPVTSQHLPDHHNAMRSPSPMKSSTSPTKGSRSPSPSKRTKAYRMFTAACTADNEARIQSAIKDLQAGTYASATAAAAAHQQTLPPAVETALANHIKFCAKGGFPLTPADISMYANCLAQQQDGTNPGVGEKWLCNFLIRHPSLKSTYSRCVENACIKAVNPEHIRQFIERLQEVIDKYKIKSDMIFNMDETGFMFGMGGKQHVVIPKGHARFKGVPGNWQSTTVIECIGSGGQVLPPLVINAGKIHMPSQERHNEWRLLLLDGHGSHVSSNFINVCWARNIAPMCFPPHVTHIMQPLDVSVFRPIAQAYTRQVNKINTNADHIDCTQFVNMYNKARKEVLTQGLARRAFSDSGLTINPTPDKILARANLADTSEASRQMLLPVSQQQTPRKRQAYITMLETFFNANNNRDWGHLKRKLINAYDERGAERDLLQQMEENRQAIENVTKKTHEPGDGRIISKDVMITKSQAAEFSIAQEAAQPQPCKKASGSRKKQKAPLPPPAPEDQSPFFDQDLQSLQQSPGMAMNPPFWPVLSGNAFPGPSLMSFGPAHLPPLPTPLPHFEPPFVWSQR
ncbi:related to transposase [Sporisorium reilianum SRZ2]|uniref:Related to transposase n=1 Tax=Sporisorium reilianum (strain SRZ2) TaxID=999809 RepID=E6ZS76_SPORE|nr:related to transposase [Sporisorium reilianum SRZ2]